MTRPVAILIGPPGSGKSTIARAVAERLGVPFRDTDEDVEAAAGSEIADIFVQQGEPHFRELERAAVERALAEHPGVLALGGGAVLDPRTEALLEGHTVVFLDVRIADAAQRIGFGGGRPLLLGNPRAQWTQLMETRRPVYQRVATVRVDTAGRGIEEVAADVLAAVAGGAAVTLASTTIRVGGEAGPQAYDVLIGHGVLDQLVRVLGEDVRRVLLVHPRALRSTATGVRADLAAAGVQPVVAEVPDAEEAKTVEVLTSLWSALGQAGFTRTDAVVGLGGGATTDAAGFAAASWLRGVPLVQVPTTLLGMVDAAVGGKTGINTAEGKNLVGAFHPPRGVICDLTALRTLPHADLVAGLAETVKCGFIADPAILELIEGDPRGAAAWDSDQLRELVERSVAVKAEVVSNDLRESGLREILNYGHTFGHAVEQVEKFRRRHGEAVSVGMVYVAELGRLAGITPPELTGRHRSVLGELGLPLGYRGDRWAALLQAMRRDKKTRGDLLRFVVLEGLARPVRLEGPSPDLLEEAYRLTAAEL